MRKKPTVGVYPIGTRIVMNHRHWGKKGLVGVVSEITPRGMKIQWNTGYVTENYLASDLYTHRTEPPSNEVDTADAAAYYHAIVGLS